MGDILFVGLFISERPQKVSMGASSWHLSLRMQEIRRQFGGVGFGNKLLDGGSGDNKYSMGMKNKT